MLVVLSASALALTPYAGAPVAAARTTTALVSSLATVPTRVPTRARIAGSRRA